MPPPALILIVANDPELRKFLAGELQGKGKGEGTISQAGAGSDIRGQGQPPDDDRP